MRALILKPCPFCASDGEWIYQNNLYAYGCQQCEVKPTTKFYPTQKAAADVWNNRQPKESEIWVMELIFNEQKANDLGYTLESCYAVIDKHFVEYGIKPKSRGVYEAPVCQNTYEAFGATYVFTQTKWFLKVIEEWSIYEGGPYAEPQDHLAAYYRVQAMHKE